MSFGNGEALEIRTPDLLGQLYDLAAMVGRVGDGALDGLDYRMGLAADEDGTPKIVCR